ncbi:MAG: signal recognition particle receptor subunit alpha, partial [Alphaproteobacteria bacterium]|nr:signal recognition particle receptor subunit alpha [Alphaproteobacteria bacterium]
MFDRLTTNFEEIFTRLRHKGSLRESDIDAALREVRAALLEADVALSVAWEFVETVRERSRG